MAKKDNKAKNRILKSIDTASKKKKKNKDKGAKGDYKQTPYQKVTNEVAKGEKIATNLAPELFNPEVNALDRLAPERRQEVADLIARSKEASIAASQQSPEMAFAIQTMKDRLGGFTTPEEEALRSRALEGVNAQYNAGMRAAAGLNLGRNLRGGAAAGNFAPVMTQALQQRRGLENDIMAQQIAERARRLSEFSKTVSDRDNDIATRTTNALTSEGNILKADRDYTTDVGKFNADQGAKELSGRIAARATGIGLIQDEKARREAANQYQEGLQYNKEALDKLLNFAG